MCSLPRNRAFAAAKPNKSSLFSWEVTIFQALIGQAYAIGRCPLSGFALRQVIAAGAG
jgi:hypothetical protein